MTYFPHPLVPLRQTRNTRHQRWLSGVSFARQISKHCNCGKGHHSLPSPCLIIPRHRFASSRFNTMFLLLLRLFYQASSFEVAQTVVQDGSFAPRLLNTHILRVIDTNNESLSDNRLENRLPDLFRSYKRFSTKDWLMALQEKPERFKDCKINSITWIKALASPFSHEFIQFIVEDSISGQRTRLAAGREETGDWVIVGWDWKSGKPPSHHYELPMPLLSVTFNTPHSRPDIQSLARVLATTTERQPSYKLSREMCWWYAETVFEEMYAKFCGTVEEWQWSRYRYSFIVRTKILPRKVLTRHAEEFKQQLSEDMDF